MHKTEIQRRLSENASQIAEIKKTALEILNILLNNFNNWAPTSERDIERKNKNQDRVADIKNRIESGIDDVQKLGLIKPAVAMLPKRDDSPEPIQSNIQLFCMLFDELYHLMQMTGHIRNLEDSEPVRFSGDIVITDPCYFTKDCDRHKTECGYKLDTIGISPFLSRNTIYGDWTCSVINADTDAFIDNFTADAGQIAVAELSAVKAYAPDFDENQYCCAVIKDFDGTVQFKIEENNFVYDGRIITDHSVHVIGNGVNTKTGEPIRFRTIQTGL